MNATIVAMIREHLKGIIKECSEGQIDKFKRLHSQKPSDKDKGIGDFIDTMPEDRLDWATTQVETTLAKRVRF